jgi:NCS2 family nucleobase:cation symporter-2
VVRKPANLIYGTDDVPPLTTTIMLGFQHAVESASKIALPIAVLTAVGTGARQIETMVVSTLLVCGIASAVISSRQRLFGFGNLLPLAIFSSFVTPAMMAARIGGLKLVAGMTLTTGAVVCLMSRTLHRLRTLFPPEVVGLIAFMVGASQASLAVMSFLGVSRSDQAPSNVHLAIAAITLAILASLSVWGKGKLRLFSSLITLVVGYLLSAAMGMVRPEQWQLVKDAAWIGFPRLAPPGISFDARLILPFVVLGLTAALKAEGDLTVSGKISDADWKRADLRAGSSGLLTMSAAMMASACLGGFAVMSSTSNVGLAAATGATSRRIGYACGAILAAMAFFPKLVALIAAVPAPVVGAMFLLVVSYNMIAGMQIIMSRMMEARHTWIVGLSLLFGLSADALPGAYSTLPAWLRPLFASGLTIATAMVVILNAVFRIGAARRQKLEVIPGETSMDQMYDFLENFGATWGARKEAIHRAVSALVEFQEMSTLLQLTDGRFTVEVTSDEFRVTLLILYRGRLLQLDKSPGANGEAAELDSPIFEISGIMLNRLTDKIRTRADGENCRIEMVFEQ